MSISISNNEGQSAVQVLRDLPIDAVLPNHAQPRRNFDEEALRELAHSIGERGVLQPVLVRPGKDGSYQLVAGERRWRAAKSAGLQSIPSLVSPYDDLEALQIALIENVAREDLNPVEEARACATLVREFGLTQEQIARGVGRSRDAVSRLMRLLKLSDEILELLERGELTASHGLALLIADDLEARGALARAAAKERWSHRVLERHACASKANALAPGGAGEQAQDTEQAQDLAAQNLARAWGDLLGAEVHVRPLPARRLRMEVLFDSAAEGIASADRLAAAIARGSKGS
jgi:ParB family chromosome partitioning protein